jgi:hypothetical protein
METVGMMNRKRRRSLVKPILTLSEWPNRRAKNLVTVFSDGSNYGIPVKHGAIFHAQSTIVVGLLENQIELIAALDDSSIASSTGRGFWLKRGAHRVGLLVKKVYIFVVGRVLVFVSQISTSTQVVVRKSAWCFNRRKGLTEDEIVELANGNRICQNSPKPTLH